MSSWRTIIVKQVARSIALNLVPCALLAQANTAAIQPLRTTPQEKLTVDGGFRDWAPTTIAGNIILSGTPSGDGGMHAVDMTTGKIRWTYRPTDIGVSVSSAPAIIGDNAIGAFGAALRGAVVAVSLTTGKPVWRGPDPAAYGGVIAHDGLAYVLGKDGIFYALDGATGKIVWQNQLANQTPGCTSMPVAYDGVVYLTSLVDPVASDRSRSNGIMLVALNAKTGQELWRYQARSPDWRGDICLRQPLVTATTIYAPGDSRLYAIDRATGKDRWPSVGLSRVINEKVRFRNVYALVEAGALIVGVTPGSLMAFDKATGKTAWEIPGEYHTPATAMAIAGNVLYFQGSPQSKPATLERGTLYAMDLTTKTILWSFSRPTRQPNWAFGTITPVDGGLWVDSFKALVLLR